MYLATTEDVKRTIIEFSLNAFGGQGNKILQLLCNHDASLRQELARLTAERDHAKADAGLALVIHDDLVKRLAQAEQAVQQMREDQCYARVLERMEQAEQERDDLKKMDALQLEEIARLEATLARVEGERDEARQCVYVIKEQVAELSVQLHSAAGNLNVMTEMFKQSAKDLAQAEQERERLRRALEEIAALAVMHPVNATGNPAYLSPYAIQRLAHQALSPNPAAPLDPPPPSAVDSSHGD